MSIWNDQQRLSEDDLKPTGAIDKVDKYKQDLAAKIEAEIKHVQESSMKNPALAVAYGNIITGLQKARKLI